MPMKGVIVAAGQGSRLRPLTNDCPKPLLKVRGRPLIDYTIEAFASAGIKELAVVIKRKGGKLHCYLRDRWNHGSDVTCLPNHLHARGNATSVLAARAFIGEEPFLLAMADHLIAPQIPAALLSHPVDAHALCVDRAAQSGPALLDATKVWLDWQGHVLCIGKRLQRWKAVDCGVFLFQPRVFRHIQDILDLATGRCSITRLVRHLVACGDPVHTVDVSGAFWMDVDTPEDLRRARAVLPRRGALALPGSLP